MTRLRVRIAVAAGLVLALSVGLGTWAYDASDRSAQRDRRDATVKQAVLDLIVGVRVVNGKLDTGRYADQAPRPGAPITGFVDGKGKLIDGDEAQSLAFGRTVVRRGGAGRTDPARLGGRWAAVEAFSDDRDDEKIAGAGFAYVKDNLGSRLAARTRTHVAIAAGAWLALTLALSLVLFRLLGRPHEAVAIERTFFADAAHELKTPWAVVRARAEHAHLEGKGSRDLEAIASTAAKAGRTIDDMLALARLDQGGLGEQVRLRLDALVETCAEEARERAGDDVTIVVHADGPHVVMGDERLLRHAVGNLIENALVHGGSGGVVRVTVAADDGSTNVVVDDNGPGVAPSQRDRIFDRFHRAAATSSGGSGLGLAIGRAIATAHGGELVYSERADGPGARFALRLPAA